MPDNKTNTMDAPVRQPESVLFVHGDIQGQLAGERLDGLIRSGLKVYAHRDIKGCERSNHGYRQLGHLLRELAEREPGAVIVLLDAGLNANPAQVQRLAAAAACSEMPLVQTALTNADPDLNPFAGLKGDHVDDSHQLAKAVDLIGPGLVHGHFRWPGHLAACSTAAVQALSEDEVTPLNALAALEAARGSVTVSDRVYAHASGDPLFNGHRLEPHESPRPPSWGQLSAGLQRWLDAGHPAFDHDIESVPGEGRPITLHITHSWGGGVALWTSTFIQADHRSRHLQLRSEGLQSGQGSGQRLSLYSGDELDCPLASWWIQPPIQSVQATNRHYSEILESICQRYGVGRVIVSSLVGHSLDALSSGLPTIQVLHDHFPVWPFLSANPGDYLDSRGKPDFAAALADRRLMKEFPDLGASSWEAMRGHYHAAVENNGVRLAAPSQSVIDLQRNLDQRWQDIAISLIPHGLPPFRTDAKTVPKPRRDERLRLVIPGRIQAGKGQKLLLKALPQLTAYAQVYLLGTGKSGEAFFGIPGVNVVIDYDREQLPEHLARIGPDLSALLSLVPETFSYTLSEMQYFGIPVIATRVGSFPGRIDHGKTGWLIEPRAGSLVEQVAGLAENPEEIARVRKAVQELQPVSPEDMAAAYLDLGAPLENPPTAAANRISLVQAQASALAYSESMQRAAKQRSEQETEQLRKEVDKRTDWALDTKRVLKETEQLFYGEVDRRKRREQWARELEAEVGHHKAEMARQAEHMDLQERELSATRTRLGKTAADLAVTKQVLDERESLLQQTSRDLEHIEQVHQQVLASSSWRITRPLRVMRRTARNFMLSRAWNPLRWPLLISGLVRNLSTVGLRGTLMRMQFGGHEAVPEPVVVEDTGPVEEANPPVSVPYSAKPRVSIIIPAFNNWGYTAACLRSISETRCNQRLEVIVVDDRSSDQTEAEAPKVVGLKYLRNKENLGFIRSCNNGVEQAQGEYIVLLNNDTRVTDGWLDKLLDTFTRFPDTGMAGAKLVYPDGTLQECGGMVFRDGSGWNYGRGDNPDRPEYQFVREVDYCSGACIMLSTELFRELGGFDEHYLPAYYEDTDLAFRIREKGLKVRVQPASVVVHFEGVTSGTDTDSGIKQYQVVNRDKFLERWKNTLDTYPSCIDDPTNPSVIRAARNHHRTGRVLIIDATTPEPDQDSGSVRLTQLMRCLRDMGYGVTFFAENHQHAGRYTGQLQQMGIEVFYQPWLESNQSFFEQRGAEFDYILVSRHYIARNFVALAKKYCPDVPFVFDTVDLHYLREQRLAELEDSLALKQVAAQTRRSELGVIEQSDAVLVVSETEVAVLEKDAPDTFVHVLSNIHDVPGRSRDFAERSDMFFVGGYQHPPNIDAAIWFVERIWPLIRARLPEATFHLIGSKAPDEVRALHGDGVIFHGFVEDIDEYLDHCRLALAPLRYGAGVKGKVNMSMSRGQPVVATPMAVEGIHAEHGHDVLVADTEQAFADEVVRVYQDEKLWNRISDAAIENVQTHFSVQAAKMSLEELFASLAGRRKSQD